MDFVSNKTIDITALALDGLMKQQRVISANVANAEVAGYQRQNVSFEDKLREIIEIEEEQEDLKVRNSHLNTAQSFMGSANLATSATMKALEAREAYSAYRPSVMGDNSPAISEDGNNVNIEKEMVEMAKTSSKYMVLSELQSRMLRHTGEIIKGAV